MIAYEEALVEEIAARLDLRTPNRRAVDAVARVLGGSDDSIEVVCDLAVLSTEVVSSGR